LSPGSIYPHALAELSGTIDPLGVCGALDPGHKARDDSERPFLRVTTGPYIRATPNVFALSRRTL